MNVFCHHIPGSFWLWKNIYFNSSFSSLIFIQKTLNPDISTPPYAYTASRGNNETSDKQRYLYYPFRYSPAATPRSPIRPPSPVLASTIRISFETHYKRVSLFSENNSVDLTYIYTSYRAPPVYKCDSVGFPFHKGKVSKTRYVSVRQDLLIASAAPPLQSPSLICITAERQRRGGGGMCALLCPGKGDRFIYLFFF